jgi:HD superfamily phosphohydrolase
MRIYDPLYGQIALHSDYAAIVNSSYFRRLQHLRQLGVCYLSFPGGNHTRFEHSLGAYYLASLVARTVSDDARLSASERATLSALLQLGALCHDIGHGPFSHMTENALNGLGYNVTHEEVGAAILAHKLTRELEPFASQGVSPDMLAQLLTHEGGNALVKCAAEMVSSDLDLDRLDYLHRDSHYSGQPAASFNARATIPYVWQLRHDIHVTRFELTPTGVSYAERILFLRRDNYQRIVYESRHMCMTAMFEKAVYAAAQTDCDFGRACRALDGVDMSWSDRESVERCFPIIWRVFGLVDYEALNQLEDSDALSVRHLVRRIRRGDGYASYVRLPWARLHYLTKQRILGLKRASQAFALRRALEAALAAPYRDVDPILIACHIPRFVAPGLLRVGTVTGQLLDDVSALGRFLSDDLTYQYCVELFIDQQVSDTSRDAICRAFIAIMEGGEIDRAGVAA